MIFETLILLLLMIISVHGGNGAHRRILHQPLFPDSSYPPQLPLTPPPPLDNSGGDSSDQPFFPEDPYGGTQYQAPPPPSIEGSMPISSTTTTTTTTTTRAPTTHPTKTIKRAAIAISIGIVALGFLSTLSFFIYRKKAKNRAQKQKTKGVMNPNPPQSNGDGSRAPPSNFLYMGTIEPHNQRSNNFSSVKKQDRYRPSNAILSSSEDEGLDDIKHAIIPSIKKTPPPQEAPRMKPLPPEKMNRSVFELQSSLPRRAKFGPPPPPPNLALLQSISNQSHHTPQLPPPLPPPPPLSAAQPVNVPPRVRSTWTNFIKKPSESQSQTSPTLEDDLREDVDTGGRISDRPKLKPLHWDKVRAASDQTTVWDQMEPSSFLLNEDMMESLFGCNSNKLVRNETTKKSVLPPVEKKENRVLDPKRSQNISILLRALNVTRDEVSEALLDGNSEALGADLLETLVKMAPTKEEEIKLTGYKGDMSKLGSAERFLKAVLDVPFAFKRVEAMLYRANFDIEVKYLRKSFQTLEEASNELKNSRLFLKLLEAVLTTGNRMNVGTNRGGAKSFKLDTLLKLVDIKASDGKTTLLHFVVQEVIRSEGTTSNTIGLSREIGKVKLAAGMDSDALHSNVTKLEIGLQKVRVVLQYERPDMKGKFFESMKVFLGKAEEEICRIKENERKALTLVRDVTEYFHGDVGKEETHPFRIFVIVKDFLSTLDYVCKDVTTVQERSVMGAARSSHISSNVRLPVLNRYNARRYDSSSEESSSP